MNKIGRRGGDEINLVEYFRLILKNWKLIFIIFFVIGGAVFVYSSFSPLVYQIDASLEIGEIGDNIIEGQEQLIEKIENNTYGTLAQNRFNLEKVPGLEAENPRNTTLINLAAESTMPLEDKEIFKKIIDLILEDHQKEANSQKGLIKKDIEKIESKISLIEEDIKNNQKKINLIQDDISQTGAKKNIVQSDISKIKNKIIANENDIQRLYKKIDSEEKEKEALKQKVDALQEQLIYEQTPGTQFALFNTKGELENKEQEIQNLYLQINALQRSIEDYNIQINSLEREKKDIDIQINSLESDKEDYNIKINSLGSGKNDLLLETNSLNKELENIKVTKVVKQANISKYPIKPRRLFNTALAGLVGIFTGVLLIFFRHWWRIAS